MARLPARLAEAENDRIWSMVVVRGFVLNDVLDNVGRIAVIDENRVLCWFSSCEEKVRG